MSDASSAADAASKNPAEGVTTDVPAAEESAKHEEATSDTEVKTPIKDEATGDQNGTGEKVKNGKSSDSYRNHKDKGERRDFKNGRTWTKKSNEFDNLPESNDPEEIRAQVEFYFSKQNLSSDWHLFQEIGGAKNYPVSIKHLTTFSRMRRFQPYSAVVEALRGSEDLVVLDDGKFSGPGNEAVQRKEPIDLPEQCKKPGLNIDDIFHRLRTHSHNDMESSVYVKGFVDEGGDVGQIELEKFFKPYGAVMVRKRRDKDDQSFKGSVFVEFDTKETQEQFLKLDPKPKFNDRELIIMSKKGYSEMKCKEKGITPYWERNDRDNFNENGRHRTYGRRDHQDGGSGRGRGRGRGRGGARARGGRWERGGRGGRDDRRPPRRALDNEERAGEAREGSGSPSGESKRKRDASDHGDGPAQEKKPKMELKVDE